MSESKKFSNYWAFGAKGWGVASAGIMFYFFWQGPIYSGSNFWFMQLNKMFGWQTPAMALPITLAGILSIFGVMFFGAMAKKMGAKRVSVICLVLAALSNMIFPLFQTYWSFAATLILYFFFSMGYSVIGVGQLGADWFPRKKGIYMGVVTVGSTLNTASISMILAFLVPAIGVLKALSIYSAIQLVVAVLVAVFIKNTPEESGAYPDNDKNVSREELLKEFQEMQEYKKHSPWTVKALITCPTMWKISVAIGICMMCGIGIIQQLVQALQSFGHPFLFGVTILTAGWPLGFLGHVFVGVIDLHIGSRNTSIFMAICLAMAPLTLILFGSTTVGAVIGAGILLFSISGVTNVIMSMSATAFGRKDFENAWPVISTIFQLISNAGVLIIATLAASLSYRKAFLVVIVLLAAAAIVMLTVPKTQISAPCNDKSSADAAV